MNISQGSSNEIETLVAPVGGVVSGEPLMIESKFCIPLADADAGDSFAALVKGEAAIASETDAAWADGVPVYWDVVGEYASITPGDGLFFIGKAKGIKAEAAATGRVNFDGIMATAGYVGDIQGVTAGTGLTGGGTSGTVTVALSTGSISSLGLADTAVQPGAALTDGTLPVADASGDLIDSSLTETNAATLVGAGDADALHTHDGKANLTDLASVANGEGASLIGIEDDATLYTATDVEAALAEVKGLADTAVQPGAALTDGTLPVADASGDLVDSALTDTNAATLTDGSNADALHEHTLASGISDVDATPAEINDVLDLSAVGAVRKIKVIDVDSPTSADQDSGWALPTKAIVERVFIAVSTPDAGKTIDIGVTGTVDGYANDVDLTSGGVVIPGAVFDGTKFTGNTVGSLLCGYAAGTDADDRGMFYRNWDGANGGANIHYQSSAGSTAVFKIYVVYFEAA